MPGERGAANQSGLIRLLRRAARRWPRGGLAIRARGAGLWEGRPRGGPGRCGPHGDGGQVALDGGRANLRVRVSGECARGLSRLCAMVAIPSQAMVALNFPNDRRASAPSLGSARSTS